LRHLYNVLKLKKIQLLAAVFRRAKILLSYIKKHGVFQFFSDRTRMRHLLLISNGQRFIVTVVVLASAFALSDIQSSYSLQLKKPLLMEVAF
jgi:hypothetical protein